MSTERLSIVGKPKFWLDNSEKNAFEYEQEYGIFAHSVIKELGNWDPDFPKDVVIVGANWKLVVEGSEQPKIDCIIWDIENRFVPQLSNTGSISKIDDILDGIQKGIQGYKFTQRMGVKMAVLDVAGAGYPIFDEDRVEIIEEREWGRIVRHSPYSTRIYHITHGYRTRGQKDYQSRGNFIDENPPSCLKTLEDDSVSNKIALYTLATINKLRLEDASTPLDVLVIGDNWKQLVMGRVRPENAQEEKKLERDQTTIFGKFWKLEEREYQESFSTLYMELSLRIVTRKIAEDRILKRMAILDRTSDSCPIFLENELDILEKRSWGRIIKPKSYNTIIYHITENHNTRYCGEIH